MVASRGEVADSSVSSQEKSLIIVFCTGAISHHDTLDMKPNAPVEIREQFNPIPTSVAGRYIKKVFAVFVHPEQPLHRARQASPAGMAAVFSRPHVFGERTRVRTCRQVRE